MRYRILFSRLISGVPFEVAAVNVRSARSPERALRAAKLRLEREYGLTVWQERADCAEAVVLTEEAGRTDSSLI
jgi:hypothetical protein